MPRPVSNPPNPWLSTHVEYLGEPPGAALEVYEEEAKSALSANDSPDIPFRHGLNPYRGCFHACAYCYARTTHQYLGFGAGTDFDRKIVVKTNIAERLALELARPSWKREAITISGNTDPYQPLEASYELTRQCLKVCRDRHNEVVVITKGALVRRDVDLLADLAAGPGACVFVSIPFLDDETGRKIEPGASAPNTRFEALRDLSDAGVTTGVSVSPVIPGLNDPHVARILERARDAGARHAFMTLLRLPGEVLPVFDARLREAFPDRADKIRNAVREMRGGKDHESGFGERMHGRGARWDTIARMFQVQCSRLGLNVSTGGGSPEARKSEHQGELF